MEKKNIKLSGNFKMNELMLKGVITPNCSVASVIRTKGARLQIELDTELDNPQKIMLGFYNEGLQNCYDVCEGYIISKNVIAFNFDEKFVHILSAAGISYYRMCVAVEYENEFSCFCIQSKNYVPTPNAVDYRGALCVSQENNKTLAAYFSQGGRLSAKVVDSKKFFGEFYCTEISALKKQESGIELELTCKSLDDQIAEPYLVSFDGRTVIPLKVLSIDSNKLAAVLDFEDMAGRDFTKYILKIKISGVPVDTRWSKGVQIEGCSLYEPISFSVNGEQHSISCGAAAKTFEFDYIEKYYSAVFSVIIAVYNTELFVAEAIESVLAQDTANIAKAIADSKNTVYGSIYELILVDDGSTDSSGEICDRYAEKYPQIKVIHKENGGVSSARNLGIEAAGGKYLNFLDSDDKFSDNVFKECFAFFEKHYDEINILTFPMKFFEAQTGNHWLNFKFNNGNRIIDCNKEYDKPVISTSSAIIKGEAVKGKIFFNENLVTGEDGRFLYEILFNTVPKIGAISTCIYWYRRRSAGEASAVQSIKETKNFYIDKLEKFSDWVIEYNLNKNGTIPKYAQYFITQELQFRIKSDADAAIAKEILTEKEFENYKAHIAKLLSYVDDNIILEQKMIYREHKLFMLKLKYQCEPNKYFMNGDIIYYYNGVPTFSVSSFILKLELMEISHSHFIIEGYNTSFEENQELYVCVNEEYHIPTRINRNKNVQSLGEVALFTYCFKFELDLDDNIDEYVIEFFEKIDNHFIKKANIKCGKVFQISSVYSKSYYSSGNRIAQMENNSLIIKLINSSSNSLISSLTSALIYEQSFVKQIEQKNSNKNLSIQNAISLRNRIITLKSLYDKIPHKKIWLISDRVNLARDNGEALFLYLMEVNDPEIDVYFVINSDCDDYERMQKYGKVLIQNTEEHKIMHVLADYVISAQADDYVTDPFLADGTSEIFKDLINKPKFIFLQHGITKDDLSDWLQKYNKNIFGFVTAALPEYKSILDCDYYYSDKEVWLTGFPRYDRLYNDPKRYITIMPTWRKFLTKHASVGINVINDTFSESNFFKFYNSLLNSERLLAAAEEYNYQICYMPHPNLSGAADLFTHHPNVQYFGFDKPYREVFAESDLMITDYSSSVMDFVYLRKPVVYCQFDREEFFSGKHTYVEGYFDYETDGFGELTFDLDSLVDQVIEYMKNGCELKDMYRERIDKFFAFNDNNNCERVYKKIKALDNNLYK